jgi:hypothetical protein
VPAGSSARWETSTVSAEQVAEIPQCEECRRVWLPADSRRWQAHWVDDGSDEKLVFFCPECAKREFRGV